MPTVGGIPAYETGMPPTVGMTFSITMDIVPSSDTEPRPFVGVTN